MTGPQLRLIATVYLVAVGAVALLVLPGSLKGLTALPALALWALWAGTRRRGLHEFDTELDEVADHACPACAGCDLPWHVCPVCYSTIYHDEADRPLVGRPVERVELGPMPDEADDPVGHWAWRARQSVWQQRGPEESAHLLAGIQPMTGPAGPTPLGHDHPMTAARADCLECMTNAYSAAALASNRETFTRLRKVLHL